MPAWSSHSHCAVGGERLVQPDVAPVGGRDGVAEPLVGELVGRGRSRWVGAPDREVVAGEQRATLRLHRQPGRAVGERQPVAVERVRPEQRLEELELVGGQVEVGLHPLDVARNATFVIGSVPAVPPSRTS